MLGRAWAAAGLEASGAASRTERTASAHADFATRRGPVEIRDPSSSMGFLLRFVDRWSCQSAFAEGAELADGAGGVALSGAGFGVEKYRKKSDFGLMRARVRPLAKLFS